MELEEEAVCNAQDVEPRPSTSGAIPKLRNVIRQHELENMNNIRRQVVRVVTPGMKPAERLMVKVPGGPDVACQLAPGPVNNIRPLEEIITMGERNHVYDLIRDILLPLENRAAEMRHDVHANLIDLIERALELPRRRLEQPGVLSYVASTGAIRLFSPRIESSKGATLTEEKPADAIDLTEDEDEKPSGK